MTDIVTGDLRIFRNNKLRKLFTKDSRETNNTSGKRAKSTIIEGLSDCIDTRCNENGIDKSVLLQWKVNVIYKVGEKMKMLSNKTSSKFHKSVLEQNNPLNILNDIHNQFVVTPIDKVNGNVAFICQQFYALVLVEELGLDHNNTGTSKTYIPVHKANNQVISDNITFLRNRFDLVVDEEKKKLPNNYWAPKIHKHPFKTRFVTAVPQYSVKSLSKAVTLVLKLIMSRQTET